jgi:Astacin (Peptidase family M12A)
MCFVDSNSQKRWINSVIPFEIDSSAVEAKLAGLIGTSMNSWEAVTPVRFVPHSTEDDFILITAVLGDPGSNSKVGRVGGRQLIELSVAAGQHSIVHELGHAIGLYHEHKRPDRDASIAVSQAAITQQPQDYEIVPKGTMFGPYDLLSVMHYEWSWPPDPKTGDLGQQKELTKITPLGPVKYPWPLIPSPGDAAGVCFMYGIVQDNTPIVAHSRDSDHMEVWVVGDDGVIRGAWFDGKWNTWYQLFGRNFPQRGHLAALGRHSEHMEVFGVGTDGLLHHIWWNGSAWQKWHTLGAPTISGLPPGTPALPPGTPLAANTRWAENEEVWVVGADRQVHGIFWDGSDWQSWYTLGGASFPPGADLVVHYRTDDQIDLWGIDDMGVLMSNWWDGNWHGWFPLPTPPEFKLVPGGKLTALGRNEDHMEVWTIGTDDRVHGIWFDSEWKHWYTLNGPFSFSPGGPIRANSRNDEQMDVFAVSNTNKLVSIWWNSGWKSWFEVNPMSVPRGTPVTPCSRDDDFMDLWCVAPLAPNPKDVGVQGVWWNGSWSSFYRVV